MTDSVDYLRQAKLSLDQYREASQCGYCKDQVGIVVDGAILFAAWEHGLSIWMLALAFAEYLALGTLYNISGKGHKAFKVLEISAACALGSLAVGTAWTGISACTSLPSTFSCTEPTTSQSRGS